jgi:hypothetical protein
MKKIKFIIFLLIVCLAGYAAWDASINYPTSLDNSTTLYDVDSSDIAKAAHHDVLAQAAIALETKLGYGSDTPTSGDFLIGNGSGSSEWRAMVSGDIPNDAITSAKIGNGEVTSADILNGTIDGVDIQNESIPYQKIEGYGISNQFLVTNWANEAAWYSFDMIRDTVEAVIDNNINSNDIVDGAITHAKLDNESVYGDVIDSDGITTTHILDGTILYEDLNSNTPDSILLNTNILVIPNSKPLSPIMGSIYFIKDSLYIYNADSSKWFAKKLD